MADREECTGIAAQWCPNCGTCHCPLDHNGERTRDRATCPLHGPESRHAETLCAGGCGEIVSAPGDRCDPCEVKHLRAIVEGRTTPPTDAELRARVTHLEGLILAMDAAHEARDASPSEATDAACSAAYGALLYAAATMRGQVVENVPIPGPEELYLNIHVRVDLSGGPGQVTARVAVDAQGSPVADEDVARELLHTVMPALRAHAAESATARAAREADDGGPCPAKSVEVLRD